MAYDGAFTPRGATVLVDTTQRQVVTSDNVISTSYRIRNPGVAAAYIGWAQPISGNVAPAIGTVAAPAAPTPLPNILGIGAGAVEILNLGTNGVWFKASSGATFEVTPGDGL